MKRMQESFWEVHYLLQFSIHLSYIFIVALNFYVSKSIQRLRLLRLSFAVLNFKSRFDIEQVLIDLDTFMLHQSFVGIFRTRNLLRL